MARRDAAPSPLQMQKPLDPDRFLKLAKDTVVSNFNEHRNKDRSPPLTLAMVQIVWFAKTLENWKAIVSSSAAKNLLWEVSYSGAKNEIYLDVYGKLKNHKITLGENT